LEIVLKPRLLIFIIMKLIIIDWDGTLVNSLKIHFESYTRAAEKLGFEIDLSSVKRLVGMTAPDIIRKSLNIKDEKRVEEILKVKDELYVNGLWKNVEPFPGAKEFIASLKDKYLLAVATSSDVDLVRPVMEKLEWQYNFIEIVGRDDVKNGKPDPEILLTICKRVGIGCSEVAYIGDSIHDMAAAKRAGVMAIGVPTGVHSADELKKAGADKVFENLFEVRDFLEKL
jgi:HAD superfamily hydrolase (TIGR01549 family)